MSFATHLAFFIMGFQSYRVISYLCTAGLEYLKTQLELWTTPSSFLQTSWPEENRYPKSQPVLACAMCWHMYGSRGSQWENSWEKPGSRTAASLVLTAEKETRNGPQRQTKTHRELVAACARPVRVPLKWTTEKTLSLCKGSQCQDQPAVRWKAQCFPTVLSYQTAPKVWEQKQVNTFRLIRFRAISKGLRFFPCKHHWTYIEDLVKWALLGHERVVTGCEKKSLWTSRTRRLLALMQTPPTLNWPLWGKTYDRKLLESILHLKVFYFESILALQNLYRRIAMCPQTRTYVSPEG